MKYKKPSPQDLRRANQSEILRKIYFEGPISRLEISQQIGISPATVTHIVSDLLAKDILGETGMKYADSGRPSTLLQINPQYGYFIGIEVGETFIKAELFDILFNSLFQNYFPLTRQQIPTESIVDLIDQSIQEMIRQAGIYTEEIIGAGIGFPGLVDPVKGVSIFTPNWGWHNVSITAQLNQRLSIPIFMDNGAKAMAVAEMLFGAGKGVNNLAVLLVGTGVGSGLIADRKLFRGTSNSAGEFGHTTLNIDGPACRCGSHGCLEAYIGANAIIDRYLRLAPAAALPSDAQIENMQFILNAYHQGDLAARQTIQETLKYLGAGIANLINLYNPEMLLVGGWSGAMFGQQFLQEIQQISQQYALPQSFERASIQLCQLGDESVTVGAAALVLEHFFEFGDKTVLIPA